MVTKKQEHVALRAVKQPWIWGGVGMIIRGGTVYQALGVLSIAWGLSNVMIETEHGDRRPSSR